MCAKLIHNLCVCVEVVWIHNLCVCVYVCVCVCNCDFCPLHVCAFLCTFFSACVLFSCMNMQVCIPGLGYLFLYVCIGICSEEFEFCAALKASFQGQLRLCAWTIVCLPGDEVA